MGISGRSDRLDFRVQLGEIRKSLVSWSGLDGVGGVKAEVPGGRGRSYGAGMWGDSWRIRAHLHPPPSFPLSHRSLPGTGQGTELGTTWCPGAGRW